MSYARREIGLAVGVIKHSDFVRADIRNGGSIRSARKFGRWKCAFSEMNFSLVKSTVKQVHSPKEMIYKLAGRVVINLCRGANLFNLAVVHHNNSAGHFQSFVLIVSDEQACDLNLLVQLTQPTAQFFADFGIQCAKRFVKQQNLWFDSQSPRQCDSLALSA